jgi:hypothetical protein
MAAFSEFGQRFEEQALQLRRGDFEVGLPFATYRLMW